MPSMKAIKRRRLTVKNIQQITKAMNLVATSKLQRAKTNLADVAKPTKATFDIAYNTLSNEEALETSYVERRKEIKKIAYVLITSNRGLCGGYNSQVCKELVRYAKKKGKDFVIIPIGTKGRDYFRRRNGNLIEMPDSSGLVTFDEAAKLSKHIVELYDNGEVDEVFVVYTKFISVLNQEPVVKPVLPVSPDFLRRVIGEDIRDGEDWENLGFFKRPEDSVTQTADLEVEYEPDLEAVLNSVIPWYLNMYMYAALASSNLCEEAARMTSMDSATNNAGDIIENLTLMFNRQRQSIITQEITEIVSGANALQ